VRSESEKEDGNCKDTELETDDMNGGERCEINETGKL
jgi:hypothetical protein